jgi:membrane protein DedA with SNARE-associated domain
LILAIIGAVIGDFVSYWFGHRYRLTVRGAWPFVSRPHLLEHADRFFHRFGSLSVAICRFIPVLRSTVPLVAGISGMERRRFVIANVLSAFVWAPAHVYPAQFAGITIDRMQSGDSESAMLWGGALLLCSIAIWVAHKQIAKRARV